MDNCYLITDIQTAILRPFIWDYPPGPVLEETFTHSHLKRVSVVILDFMKRGEDNRGKFTNNPAGRCAIWTIDAPNSIFPSNFMLNTLPSNLSWLGTGTKYAGLHTWRLGYLITRSIIV